MQRRKGVYLSEAASRAHDNEGVDDGFEGGTTGEGLNAQEDERKEEQQNEEQKQEEADKLSSGEAQHGEHTRSHTLMHEIERNFKFILAHGAVSFFRFGEDTQGFVLGDGQIQGLRADSLQRSHGAANQRACSCRQVDAQLQLEQNRRV